MRTFLILCFVAVAACFVVMGTRRGAERRDANARAGREAIDRARAARVQAQLVALQGEIDQRAADVQLWSNRCSEAKARVAVERRALDPLRDQLRQFTERELKGSQAIEATEARATRYERALAEAHAELATLKKDLATARVSARDAEAAAREKADARIAAMQSQVDQQQRLTSTADKLVKEITTRNQRLQTSVASAHAALAKRDARIAELEAALKALQTAAPAATPPAPAAP